jgi:hypothetical protein
MAYSRTKSFSGADARVYAWYPGAPENVIELDSMQTISVSVHEAKSQARALGYRGIRGLARGVRTIAGSMILTAINDNPLRPLMEAVSVDPEVLRSGSRMEASEISWPGWSIDKDVVGVGTIAAGYDFSNRLGTLLPPVNIVIRYVNEDLTLSSDPRTGLASGETEYLMVYLSNVEFVDESTVTSINDMITEVTMSFIAADIKPMHSGNDRTSYKAHPLNEAEQRAFDQLVKKSFAKSERLIKRETRREARRRK